MSTNPTPVVTVLSTAVLAGLATLSMGAASAQSADPSQDTTNATTQAAPATQPDAATTLDSVRVSGSRVMSAGYETPTPMTVVDFEQIQLAAPNNIADYLNTLPSLV